MATIAESAAVPGGALAIGIAQEVIQSEVATTAIPAALESVAQAVLEPNATTASPESAVVSGNTLSTENAAADPLNELVGQIAESLNEAPSSDVSPITPAQDSPEQAVLDPGPQPQSASQSSTTGASPGVVARAWSWSSIKSSVKPVKEKWESYGPAVHASLAVLDLFILSWQLHSMRDQNSNVQVVLASPKGYNTTAATLQNDKKLSAELHDLTSQALEQKKWDQMHDYVQTCLEYLKSDLKNDKCQNALLQVGIAPPFSPKDFSVAVHLKARDVAQVPSITSSLFLSRPSNASFIRASNGSLAYTLDVSYEPVPIAYSLTGILPCVIAIGLLLWKIFSRNRKNSFAIGYGERKGSNNLSHASEMSEKQQQSAIDHDSMPIYPLDSVSSGIHFVEQNATTRARRPAKKTVTLHSAAFEGDLNNVSRFLAQKPDLNAIDPKFGTVIAAAAQGAQLEIAQLLLKQGASVSNRGCKYGTALHSAVWSGSLDIVNLVLDNGADLEVQGSMGTALALAINRGLERVAKSLIDRGADIHVAGGAEGSPIQAAVAHEMVDLVQLLLDLGVDVNSSLDDCGSPLQLAAMHDNTVLAKKLLGSGADLEQSTSMHGTPLQIACRHGYTDLATLLIDHKARCNLVDENERTPLHDAARLGRERLCRLLIETGDVEVNACDADLWTPLHHASCHGHAPIISLLLSHGANAQAADKFGAHALFRAAGLGFPDCVKLLLEAGSPAGAVDCFGRNALHGPPSGDDVSVPRLLLESGGVDVNARGNDGKTALHESANTGNDSATALLLSWPGVKSDIQDNDQMTPLHRAVMQGHDKVAMRLLAVSDVDIDARGGNTLQAAIARSSNLMVTALLDKGAKVNAQGGQYGSAIGAAAYAGNMQILKLLGDRRAGVNINGGEFGSPLQAAVVHGHVEVVAWLLERGAQPSSTGGRFGCPLRAARKAVINAKIVGWVDPVGLEVRLQIEQLLIEAEAEELPYNERGDERWALMPGGWGWIPKA